MKKILFLFVSLAVISFTSCDSDDTEKETTVSIANVKVTENGEAKPGVTVYMFNSKKGPSTGFFTPLHSDKKVVTETNGVASFNLQEVYDLNIIDSQTTLYFGVFNGEALLGNTAITIKKGEAKTVNIKL